MPSTILCSVVGHCEMYSRAGCMFRRERLTTDSKIKLSRSAKYRYTVARDRFAARATSSIVVFMMPNRAKHLSAAARMLERGSAGTSPWITEATAQHYRRTVLQYSRHYMWYVTHL